MPEWPNHIQRVVSTVLKLYADSGVLISPDTLVGPSQHARICRVRWEIWWRIRCLPTNSGQPISYSRIGIWFNRVDHTTVMHGISRWLELRQRGLYLDDQRTWTKRSRLPKVN